MVFFQTSICHDKKRKLVTGKRGQIKKWKLMSDVACKVLRLNAAALKYKKPEPALRRYF